MRVKLAVNGGAMEDETRQTRTSTLSGSAALGEPLPALARQTRVKLGH